MAVELLRQLASQRSGFAAAGPSDSSLRSEFKSLHPLARTASQLVAKSRNGLGFRTRGGLRLGSGSSHRLTAAQRDELRKWNLQNRWSPNQVRHAAAAQVRKVAGLETAGAVLGHSTAGVTEQYYAEVDLEKAASVMKRIA
ncbi:MAG: hypothetical protein ACO396_11065 [Phycisphaerales bacterium]